MTKLFCILAAIVSFSAFAAQAPKDTVSVTKTETVTDAVKANGTETVTETVTETATDSAN